MIIENKVIDTLSHEHLNFNESIHISNSIIKTVDFDTIEFINEISINSCIIESFLVHSTWFKKGLILKNNQFINPINYQMGGHNQKSIYFDGNIFLGFFNFFDCQFEELLEIKNNIFIKGSNLLGNKNEGFHNIFDNGIIEYNNLGEINMDGLGN